MRSGYLLHLQCLYSALVLLVLKGSQTHFFIHQMALESLLSMPGMQLISGDREVNKEEKAFFAFLELPIYIEKERLD